MRTTTPKRAEVIGEEAAAVVRAPLVPSKMMAAVLYGSEDLRLEKSTFRRSPQTKSCFACGSLSPMAPT